MNSKVVPTAYHFQWDFHKFSLSDDLAKVMFSHSFSDVSLVTHEGNQIPAHKLVLSSGSKYFKYIFQRFREESTIIIVTNVSDNILRHLLEFMYVGSTKVASQESETFLEAARSFMIYGIFENKDEDNMREIDYNRPSPQNIKCSLSRSPIPELELITASKYTQVNQTRINHDFTSEINNPLLNTRLALISQPQHYLIAQPNSPLLIESLGYPPEVKDRQIVTLSQNRGMESGACFPTTNQDNTAYSDELNCSSASSSDHNNYSDDDSRPSNKEEEEECDYRSVSPGQSTFTPKLIEPGYGEFPSGYQATIDQADKTENNPSGGQSVNLHALMYVTCASAFTDAIINHSNRLYESSTFPTMDPSLLSTSGLPHPTLSNLHNISNITNSLDSTENGLNGLQLTNTEIPQLIPYMQERNGSLQLRKKRKATDSEDISYKTNGTVSVGRFICDSCERTYASTGNLKRHKTYECGRSPQFECLICKCMFQHRHSLKIHVKAKHPLEYENYPSIIKRGPSSMTGEVFTISSSSSTLPLIVKED